MIFIALLVLTTMALAGAAGFFAVVGLAAIFSGTFWSVVFMGGALEAGKLMAASYLYRYWEHTNIWLKTYLIAGILALMLLKVKVDESGYELVHTAALPRFYGFALSSDGSELLLTEGRDANFNAQDFLAWTLAEGVTFALHQNALEVQL